MRDYWEKGVSGALAVAALVMAGVLVHSEFFGRPGGSPRRGSQYVADWKAMLPAGRRVGNSDAPITIIEFTDLQCPFCHRLNDALRVVRQKFPQEVAYSFVHFPLSAHAQADGAARAAECALAQGKFVEAVDLIFDKQDSLGKKPWTSYARDAGVADTVKFTQCLADVSEFPMIAAGLALGKKVGLDGTPTVILNGWRYGVPPSDSELVRAIGDILSGKPPYRGFPTKELRPIALRDSAVVLRRNAGR